MINIWKINWIAQPWEMEHQGYFARNASHIFFCDRSKNFSDIRYEKQTLKRNFLDLFLKRNTIFFSQQDILKFYVFLSFYTNQ